MTADAAMRFFQSRVDGLGPEDFETASIRSAAPSYVSEAPSYHSTVPQPETTPPYAPPASGPSSGPAVITTADTEPSRSRTPQPLPRPSPQHQPTGLPPLPPLPAAAAGRTVPNLSEFRIPTWSTISANPTARHYHNVAQRRLARDAADSASGSLRQLLLRQTIEHEEEVNARQFRPLEDPYLVGEVAARSARAERLARESGEDILIREDRRWDMLLSQMRDWNTRDRSWTRMRRDAEPQRTKFAGRLGGRLML